MKKIIIGTSFALAAFAVTPAFAASHHSRGPAAQTYPEAYDANAATTAPPPGLGPVWLITPTTRYAAGCSGACTPGALVNPGMTVASMSVPLVPPNTVFADRINELDVTVARWFTIPGSRVRLQPEASVFNLLNRSPDYAVRSLNYGTASYLQPSSVLQGRYLRLGMQAKW